jgi:hypothetical protein
MESEDKMSEFEVSIPIDGSQYDELMLVQKRGDQYSLVLGRRGKENGTNYMQWGHPSGPDKQPRPKAIPWKIPLGNYTQATTMIEKLMAVFVKPTQTKNEPDSDIPF